MSIAMDAAGCSKDFRGAIVEVLLESVLEVIDGDPWPGGHEAVVYKRDFLYCTLPASAAGKCRCIWLLTLLTSDIREPFLQLRVPGGSRNICLKSWAKNVSKALLPNPIALYPRH